MKYRSVIVLAGALLGAVSCSPINVQSSGTDAVGAGELAPRVSVTGAEGSSTRVTSSELRQLREQREQLERGGQSAGIGNEQLINAGRDARSGGGGDGGYEADLPPLPELSTRSTNYRYAVPVPGREGWVYNPYTNRTVDVRGVGSGLLIYDERDPENRKPDGTLKPVSEMPNKFRVP